jgi:hypothetical protein
LSTQNGQKKIAFLTYNLVSKYKPNLLESAPVRTDPELHTLKRVKENNDSIVIIVYQQLFVGASRREDERC